MTNFRDDVNTVPGEDGTTWVEIASSGSVDEAKILAGFLEAEGIAAQIEDLQPSMGPMNIGMLGDVRIYVAAADEARAMELLRKREDEYQNLDDDEETLVTDEGQADIDENTTPEPE